MRHVSKKSSFVVGNMLRYDVGFETAGSDSRRCRRACVKVHVS